MYLTLREMRRRQAERMIAIRHEIMPKIKDDDWIILTSDETRIMLEV